MKKLTLQFFYSFLLRWFLKLIVGVKFDDAAFLLKEERFIIVANHNSHLDTMSLMASIPRKMVHKVKPVAAQDHFGKNRFQRALTTFFVNALLIPRKRDKENPANDPIQNMIDALDRGNSLIIFPEGTRGEPEQEAPLKPGVALVLSQRSEHKYVPVYMKGMGKAMPKGDNLIIPFNSTLRFGQATEPGTSDVDTIMERIGHDLQALKEERYYKGAEE